MTLALITGASGGIGRALATLHAKRGGDLIVTARRLPELETLARELKDAHGVNVTPVAADIGTQEGLATILAATEGQEIDILINNAGFGGRGRFVERPLADDLNMVDVNIVAVMTLCHAIGTRMVARGQGRILNVGSTAGMLPGPLQATYFASKAFVNSFSQALDEEMRKDGVTVTVLAPGYVATDFAARADLEGTALTKGGSTPDAVAKVGYDAMMKGKLVAINEGQLKVATRLLGLLPRRQVLKMARRMQSK
ncbi:SDR family oxidoreductase [uncultured Jannaschia sp.]|uniref:SDR family NAD(P)-dependent oxidoreductase n=1 Tax=uncultured Jannaschia sp. TaxID=293347 RepID=UPI00260984B2|nr:SDR family oxidoreductase [uncultured Jannaschia sp.]